MHTPWAFDTIKPKKRLTPPIWLIVYAKKIIRNFERLKVANCWIFLNKAFTSLSHNLNPTKGCWQSSTMSAFAAYPTRGPEIACQEWNCGSTFVFLVYLDNLFKEGSTGLVTLRDILRVSWSGTSFCHTASLVVKTSWRPAEDSYLDRESSAAHDGERCWVNAPSELVQDRRARGASIQDVVNSIGDTSSTRLGGTPLQSQVSKKHQLFQFF